MKNLGVGDFRTLIAKSCIVNSDRFGSTDVDLNWCKYLRIITIRDEQENKHGAVIVGNKSGLAGLFLEQDGFV